MFGNYINLFENYKKELQKINVGSKARCWIQNRSSWRRWCWKNHFCQAPYYWRVLKEIHCYTGSWCEINHFKHQSWPNQAGIMGYSRTIKTWRTERRLLHRCSCCHHDVRCHKQNHLQEHPKMAQRPNQNRWKHSDCPRWKQSRPKGQKNESTSNYLSPKEKSSIFRCFCEIQLPIWETFLMDSSSSCWWSKLILGRLNVPFYSRS